MAVGAAVTGVGERLREASLPVGTVGTPGLSRAPGMLRDGVHVEVGSAGVEDIGTAPVK